MTPQQRFTRRRFLDSAAATSGGILFSGAIGLGADSSATPPDFPSTDHFWYRQQAAGPYIDSQRENRAFGYADGKIFLSEDNGRTWPHSIAFCRSRPLIIEYVSTARGKHDLNARYQYRRTCDSQIEG